MDQTEEAISGKEGSEIAQNAPTESKPKASKDRKKGKDKVKPLTKVTIRRLPPTMTEEDFAKQIEPIPEHDYFYYVPADWSLGQHATCRAYINFRHQNDIFIFKDKFDGYVFVDTKGIEFPAIVEFAPFQGLPKGKSRKKDNKANTIETEAHYLSFIESLKEDENENKGEMKMEYSFQLKDDEKITSTPLLEYIANVKQGHREERKRKNEERKRTREEEKQRKKNQVAKSIPKAIQEDEKENDDGIVVRTVKSRLDRSKRDGKDDNDKSNKSDRDKRDEKKRAEQQRQKERREAKRKGEREQRKTSDKPKTDETDGNKTKSDDKEKVKKYSESRRERRARAEQSRSNSNTFQVNDSAKASGDQDTANANQDKVEKPKSINDGQTQKDEKNYTKHEYNKKDRSIQNIRNKDRPAIQIYQPGKRRPEPGESFAQEKEFEQRDEKPAGAEKKVSRYSERRNKAREKRSNDGNEIDDSKETTTET